MRYSFFLVTLFLVSCGVTESPPTPAPEAPLYASADFPIGGAINIRKVANDPELRAIATTEFSSITATNDMKMYRIAREEGMLDFSRADSTIAFAKENGQRVFGHTLLWHYGLPDYVKEMDAPALRNFLTEYIDTVVTHFHGEVDGWDVVNEAMATRGGALRNTHFLEVLGPDYLDLAFRAARAADPDVKLFINDFGTERDTAKIDALVELVEDMHARNIPIDGIGFQWHQQMGDDTTIVRRNLERAVATGLLIHISELDLIFNTHDDSKGGGVQLVRTMTPELLQAQADRYEYLARLYREVVPPAQRYGITFWDFTDRDSWIDGFFEVDDWPTVYDDELRRKPAYDGFRRGISAE